MKIGSSLVKLRWLSKLVRTLNSLKSNYSKMSNKPELYDFRHRLQTNSINLVASALCCCHRTIDNRSTKSTKLLYIETQLTSKWHERVKLPQSVSSVIIIVKIMVNDSILDVCDVVSYHFNKKHQAFLCDSTHDDRIRR